MKNKKIMSFIAVFLSIVVVFVGVYSYNNYLSQKLGVSTKKTLDEITMQQQFNVNAEINSQITSLKNVAVSISLIEVDKVAVVDILNKMQENVNFDHVIFAGTDGIAFLQSGKTIDISGAEYFKKAIQGETVVIEPKYDDPHSNVYFRKELKGETVLNESVDAEFIRIAMPVVKNENIIGVVSGDIVLDNIQKLILPSFEGQGYVFVINKDGKVMVSVTNDYTITTSNNFFNELKNANFNNGLSFEEMKKNILLGKSGLVKYTIDKYTRYAQHMPLDVNGWSIVVVVPEDIIASEAKSVTQSTSVLLLLIMIILIVLMSVIFFIQNKSRKALTKFAFYDEFTGAPTLAKFKMEAQSFIDENSHMNFLMVKFDIKEFKILNQILGEQMGDRVILNITKALRDNTPGKYERFARLHDDEFLVLHTYEYPNENIEIKHRFEKMFYEYMGNEFKYPLKMISGHYYMSDDNFFNISEAIEKANIAHRMARQTGRGICIYDKAFVELALKEKEVESKAENAIKNYEFKVYLQPKYELEGETIVGAEALVRWIGDEGTVMFPGDFIPIFEKNHFITKLDFYMFEETCKIINGWLRDGLIPVPISVNFSRCHLFDDKFVNTLCEIADKYNVDHNYLEVELTETIVMSSDNDLNDFIVSLHKHNFQLSIDDFGSGYSSLGVLKNLNIDTVKFDRSFFVDAEENSKTHSVLSNMLNMVIDLGIRTVAEGVEEKKHVELLRKLNCDVIQGYYFGRPMPALEFTQKINKIVDAEIVVANDRLKRLNLRKNNELLADVMESMPLAFTLWNKNSELVQCNKEAAKLIGFQNSDELIERIEETVPEYQPNGQLSLSLFREYISHAFEHGYGQYCSWNFRHTDGTAIPSEITFVRIINKGEVMVTCYVRDMRLQIEAENMIEQERYRLQTVADEYRQLLDATPLCINVWGRGDKLIMCNKAARSMFDIDSEQIYIDRFYEFSPEYQPNGDNSSEKAVEYVKLTYEKGETSFKWMHRKLNGDPVPTEIKLVRITLNGEPGVAGFVRKLKEWL